MDLIPRQPLEQNNPSFLFLFFRVLFFLVSFNSKPLEYLFVLKKWNGSQFLEQK